VARELGVGDVAVVDPVQDRVHGRHLVDLVPAVGVVVHAAPVRDVMGGEAAEQLAGVVTRGGAHLRGTLTCLGTTALAEETE